MSLTNHLLLNLLFPAVFILMFTAASVYLHYILFYSTKTKVSRGIKWLVYFSFVLPLTIIPILLVISMGKGMALSAYYLINNDNIPQFCATIEDVKYEKAKNEGIKTYPKATRISKSKSSQKIINTYNIYYSYYNKESPETKYQTVNPYDIIFNKALEKDENVVGKQFCFRGHPDIVLFKDVVWTN